MKNHKNKKNHTDAMAEWNLSYNKNGGDSSDQKPQLYSPTPLEFDYPDLGKVKEYRIDREDIYPEPIIVERMTDLGMTVINSKKPLNRDQIIKLENLYRYMFKDD